MECLRRQYSLRRPRFLEAVVGRRGRGASGLGIARPFVVLAARFLGPGPTRLRLVKLAHQMCGGSAALAPKGAAEGANGEGVQSTERAA